MMSAQHLNLSVIIRLDAEAGGYVAECLDIPGCLSEGDTVEEALSNVREAAQGCLLSMIAHGDPLPAGTTFLASVPVEVAS